MKVLTGKRAVFAILILFIILILVLVYFKQKSSIINFKAKIECSANCIKIKREKSYILKNVKFKGIVGNPKGLKLYYIDSEEKENNLFIQLSNNLLKTIKEKGYLPERCNYENGVIYTKYFTFHIPKDLRNKNIFYCFSNDKDFFIMSAPSEKKLNKFMASYIEISDINEPYINLDDSLKKEIINYISTLKIGTSWQEIKKYKNYFLENDIVDKKSNISKGKIRLIYLKKMDKETVNEKYDELIYLIFDINEKLVKKIVEYHGAN